MSDEVFSPASATPAATDYSGFFDAAPATNDLVALSELARQMYEAEIAVAQKEEDLKKAQEILKALAERDIPELMSKVGMEEFTTTSGFKLKINNKVRASIPATDKERAFEWLEAHGFGGIIKRTIAVAFNRDQQEAATKLEEQLREQEYDVKRETKVESSTLTAFVKEQLKNNKDEKFPKALFGAYEFKLAEIKPKKG